MIKTARLGFFISSGFQYSGVPVPLFVLLILAVRSRKHCDGWTNSTVAHKCTPNLNHSHQIQITHTEFESLTLNWNHSRRIRNTHTKFKLFTPNSKTLALNSKTLARNSKTLAPNSSRSHRFHIAHTDFKSLTPNSNLHTGIESWHRIQITHTEFKTSHRRLVLDDVRSRILSQRVVVVRYTHTLTCVAYWL